MSRYITPKVKVEDLLLISEEESEIRCGKCNVHMFYTVYYKDKESFDFLVCKDCKIYMQRIIEED
jgi:peptide subunit release factor 1 (eRF1)